MATKNTQMGALITALKKQAIEGKRPLWKRVASDLEKPSRQRRIINLWKLDQYAKDGEIVIVPGKVLGDGQLTKNVTVAAYSYSAEAKKKLDKNALTIPELLKKHPDGKGIRIMG
ncbi:50S ribosomal protein L18e [Candidatus Woesearchaeota archaeon]|nr:50S ribosomal protein L18e [Candidatus Woesearchaeota archaeon]